MIATDLNLTINWRCKHTWKTASNNTSWCLLGCAIGDLGTIGYFQFMGIVWPVWAVMSLAIFNGLVTSILLETIILAKQMSLKFAFKTAIGMSLISMISMELAMNITDVVLTGGAVLTWWVIHSFVMIAWVKPV